MLIHYTNLISNNVILRLILLTLFLTLLNARLHNVHQPPKQAKSNEVVAYPSAFVDKSSFTRIMYNNSIDTINKPIINIVIYDKVVGYLNWIHNEFKAEALANCNTKCTISSRRDEVSSILFLYIFVFKI